MTVYPPRFKELNRKDASFYLGWLSCIAVWIVGNALSIDEEGFLSWWFLLYVAIGIIIFMAGTTLARKRRDALVDELRDAIINEAYAEGYSQGINDALASIERHNGKWGHS